MIRLQSIQKTLAAGIVLCLAYTGMPADAADPPKGDPVNNPVIVYTQGPMKGEYYSSADLIQRLKELEKLRVIVGLDFEMVDPHLLSQAKARAQAGRLADLQKRVLSALPDLSAEAPVIRFESIPYIALTVDEAQIRSLLNDSRVVSIQEDGLAAGYLGDSTEVVSVDKLWDPSIGLTGKGWTVAVLDTGTYHPPMLPEPGRPGSRYVDGACYASEWYYSPWRTWLVESTCKPGLTEATGIEEGKECPIKSPGLCSHGTHVATIVAGDDGTLKGVAPGANIMRIQVFSKINYAPWCAGAGRPPPCVLTYTSDQIKALERVYALRNTHNFAAVNMSLGGGEIRSYCDATHPGRTDIINQLTAAGIAVVIASGNSSYNGAVGAPSCIRNAVTVGSTTKDDGISGFSNHATMIDIMAPGSAILAGIPHTSYDSLYGTSMAAPHVAGAFAVLREGYPAASVDLLLAALQCTGEPVARASISRNRIDLRRAWKFLNDGRTNCNMPTPARPGSAEWLPRHKWL